MIGELPMRQSREIRWPRFSNVISDFSASVLGTLKGLIFSSGAWVALLLPHSSLLLLAGQERAKRGSQRSHLAACSAGSPSSPGDPAAAQVIQLPDALLHVWHTALAAGPYWGSRFASTVANHHSFIVSLTIFGVLLNASDTEIKRLHEELSFHFFFKKKCF